MFITESIASGWQFSLQKFQNRANPCSSPAMNVAASSPGNQAAVGPEQSESERPSGALDGAPVRSSRILYLDMLRIFSVFCMMMLHVAASNWNNVLLTSFDWQVFNVYDSLVRFCVPVFIMISGALFLQPSHDTSLKKLFTKNIPRIITAFLFWSGSYAFLSCLFKYRTLNSEVILQMVKRLIVGHYHLWFLFALVGLYLIIPFLKKFTADRSLCIYFMALAFLFGSLFFSLAKFPALSKMQVILDDVNLYFVLGYTGYFVAGYYFASTEISPKARKIIYSLGTAAAACTIFFTYFLSNRAGEPVKLLYDHLTPNCCLASLAVFLFFKQHFQTLTLGEKASQAIALLAKCSFGMYLVHDYFNIFLRLIGLTTLSFHPVLSVPILSLLVFGLSFLVILPLQKIPVFNKYCL